MVTKGTSLMQLRSLTGTVMPSATLSWLQHMFVYKETELRVKRNKNQFLLFLAYHLFKPALSAPVLHRYVPFSSDITPHKPQKQLREDIYHLVFKSTSPALLHRHPQWGLGPIRVFATLSVPSVDSALTTLSGSYFCCCFTFG